jgi:hypothetical protein
MPAVFRAVLAFAITAFVLGLLLHPKSAHAGMVGTDAVAPVQSERERVKELVARPEVAKKLESLGVLPQDAKARIDALTNEEVHALAQKIDALPAGGMTDTNWLLVIVVVLLIIIIL